MFMTKYKLFGVLYLIIETSSHFLGGTVKWMTVSHEMVKFTYRLSWERGTGPCGPGCTEADIKRTGNVSLPMLRGLHWICTSSNGIVQVGDVNYIMTSISRKPNGWEQGEGFFLHKFNGTGPFSVSLENFSWVPPISSTAPSLGYMKTFVDLNIRGDTGKPNGSPYASLPSIIGIQYNCISIIKLPVDDPDGDLIRCRWAEPQECRTGCTNVPPNTVILDKVECTLTVSAHASTGYLPNQNYRLTLVVEDFPEYVLDFGGQNLTRRHRMSFVPLQFSVRVVPLLESCDMTKNAVKFVFPNLLARQSYGSNEIKNISFVRAPMYLAYNDTETEFMASVPARTSIITKHDNYNRTNVTIFASEMFPQLPDQDGDNQFCAWANDKNGVTSVPRCIVVNIDDENNCLRQFCKNNGTCINLYHREKCRCPFGLKPPDCSRSLSCIDFPCENNATCTNTGKDYVCMCIPGFTGADCEHEVNECASNPCQNNGICLDRRNSFQCICPAIFTGYRCEHDIRMCASDPCLNGASCLNSSSSFNFTCTCHPEYSGRFCEIDVDECPAFPCQHGGSCTNLVGDYNCLCVHPYTGKNCENEIDICTMSPCKNGGRCHRQHLSYYCDCTRGWRGTNCTDKVDLCASHPCTNGGSCRDTGDDYLCSCPSGFGVHGSNEPCATTDKASSNQIFVDVNNNLTWPILAAIIGGLLCGVLLMACCCWFLLGRSKKRDDEDPQRDNTPKPQPRWAYARRISVTPFPIPRSSKKDLPALKSNLPAVESSKQTDDLSVSEEVPALDTVADPVTMWPYLKSFNANNSEKLTSDSSAHPISNRNETPQNFNIYRSSANDPHIHKCGKHIDAEEYFQYM